MSIARINDMIADTQNEILGLKEKVEVAKERQQARLSRVRRDIEELDKAAESDDRGRTERDYVQYLNDNDNEGTISILGIEYQVGDVLKEIDPDAFAEFYSNWYDAQPSPDPDYGDLLDELDAAEEAIAFCEEAEEYLNSARSELADAEGDVEEARHILDQLDDVDHGEE